MSIMVSFLVFDEVKEHLNIPLSDTTHDTELQRFIDSACEVVESIVGAVGIRSVTETHSGTGDPRIVLRQYPAMSVTSVTVDGVQLDPSGYSLSSAGVLTRAYGYRVAGYVEYPGYPGCGSYGGYGGWPRGVDNITVVYPVGRDTVPASVADGTKELIRINWRPQVGGNSSVFDQGRADTFGQSSAGEIRLGFFVPNTVMQRLQPSEQPMGIA